MNADGDFVNAKFGSRFMFSLLNDDIELPRGKYVFMIDPIWDPCTVNDDSYTEVLIDVMST